MRRVVWLCAIVAACGDATPPAPTSHPPSYDSPAQVTVLAPPADAWDLVSLPFTVRDAESDSVNVSVEWSVGGTDFAPATAAAGQKTSKIPSSRTGRTSRFVWDSRADLGDRNVEGIVMRFTVSDPGGVSSALSTGFTVHDALYVTHASPGDPGDRIELSGHGFGGDPQAVTVHFPAPLAATIDAVAADAGDELLHVVVPAGVVAGALSVTTRGDSSNSIPFATLDRARFVAGPAAPSASPVRPLAADVDGDGRVDLLQGAVLRNQGGGAFTAIGPPLDGPALAGDLDGDGRCDLVTLPAGAAPVLWLQTAPGSFAMGALEGAGATGAKPDGALFDADGDGAADLVVLGAQPDGHAGLWLWTGAGLGAWHDSVLEAAAPASRVAVLGSDLVLGRSGGAELLRAMGGGAYGSVGEAFGYRGPRADQVALLGDVDGDGIFDLVASAPLALYRGAGAESFVVSAGLYAPVDPTFAAVGDVNDDGRPDVYAVAPGHAYLFLSTGGGFVESAAAAGITAPQSPRGALVVDLDGDGRLDLYDGERIHWNRPQVENGEIEVTLRGHWAGTRVLVSTPDGGQQVQTVQSSALPMHFGLGPYDNASLEVDWPSGKKIVRDVARGDRLVLTSS